MSRSATIFIDGKEIKKLEGSHKERKAYTEAFKRLKAQFRHFKVVEHDESNEAYLSFLSSCENILDATPSEKLTNAIDQAEVHLTCIIGRRVVLKEVRAKLEQALEQFRETKTNKDIFKFKALLDQYRSLLTNDYREIRFILAKLKIPAVALAALDLRYLLRTRSKLISRNVDDEDSFSVKKAQDFKRLLFTLNEKNHEQKIYRGHHIKLGVLLQ